jgi:hypothetical protein
MATATITFGTFASDNSNGATGAWSNGSNAASSNNGYATCLPGDGLSTQRFKFTNGSGGEAIDDAATISAVRLFVEGSAAVAAKTFTSTEAYLVKGGTTQTGATNKASGTINSTTDATKQFGAADTFGVTLTGADVKDSGFGGSLVYRDDTGDEGTNTIRFDYVYAEVDYENPAAAATPKGFERARMRLLGYMRREALAS